MHEISTGMLQLFHTDNSKYPSSVYSGSTVHILNTGKYWTNEPCLALCDSVQECLPKCVYEINEERRDVNPDFRSLHEYYATISKQNTDRQITVTVCDAYQICQT